MKLENNRNTMVDYIMKIKDLEDGKEIDHKYFPKPLENLIENSSEKLTYESLKSLYLRMQVCDDKNVDDLISNESLSKKLSKDDEDSYSLTVKMNHVRWAFVVINFIKSGIMKKEISEIIIEDINNAKLQDTEKEVPEEMSNEIPDNFEVDSADEYIVKWMESISKKSKNYYVKALTLRGSYDASSEMSDRVFHSVLTTLMKTKLKVLSLVRIKITDK